MLSFNNDDNSAWLKGIHQRVSNLTCHPLLNLRTPRVYVDQPRKLRQAGYLALLVRNVTDVSAAEEWHQVMLAGRVELDVAHEHHFLVVGIEDCSQDVLGRELQAGELLSQRTRDSRRSVPQAFAVRILAYCDEYLGNSTLDPRKVKAAVAQ
jgi:hypothetical protein